MHNPQILLQLRDAELKQAHILLKQGRVGMEVVDFARPTLLTSDWEQRLAELLPLCQQWAGPITMHGPFLDLSPVSPDPGLRELTLQRYRQALYIAAQLKASYLVFHTQYNPNIREPAYLSGWVAANARFWTDLLPDIEASNTIVVLENMWDPRPDHIASLLASVDSPRLLSCLDVAHAHLFSEVSLEEWVVTLGDKLAYVHLSDNHSEWDEHLALGDGTVDFATLFAALRKQAITPLYVLEINSFKDAMRSLKFLGWDLI